MVWVGYSPSVITQVLIFKVPKCLITLPFSGWDCWIYPVTVRIELEDKKRHLRPPGFYTPVLPPMIRLSYAHQDWPLLAMTGMQESPNAQVAAFISIGTLALSQGKNMTHLVTLRSAGLQGTGSRKHQWVIGSDGKWCRCYFQPLVPRPL